VGLTRTSRYYFIAEPPTKFLYLPFAQEQNSRMSLLVETYGEPAGIATPLRSVVRGIDPNQPIYNVRTFSSFYEARAVSVSLTIMQTVATMGLLGLTLALIGLYGLIAYSVSRRTKEIGIRMAIGANKTEVMRMILRQGFILAGAGILVGGAISVVVAQMLTIGLSRRVAHRRSIRFALCGTNNHHSSDDPGCLETLIELRTDVSGAEVSLDLSGFAGADSFE